MALLARVLFEIFVILPVWMADRFADVTIWLGVAVCFAGLAGGVVLLRAPGAPRRVGRLMLALVLILFGFFGLVGVGLRLGGWR